MFEKKKETDLEFDYIGIKFKIVKEGIGRYMLHAPGYTIGNYNSIRKAKEAAFDYAFWKFGE